MDEDRESAAVDPRIHRSPDDTDIDLTEATLALHDWEEEEERRRDEAIHNRRPLQGLQIDPDIDFYPEVADREPGDRNIVRAGFDIHPQVTFWSSGILLAFILLSIFVDGTQDVFSSILDFINEKLGWFYILDFNIFLIVAIYFAFSRYGKIKLGGPFALPEFSTVSWYAMLLSAGLGIGLMFWGVAEPIFHFTSPAPFFEGVEAGTGAAGKAALATTYLHWGVHGWALYGLVALALGFFAYNRGLPLTFRSIFFPILGKKIYGTWGNVIDILTVMATLFGLATSLGFGASQASAGLNKLFGLPDEQWFQVLLIVGITVLATISVVAGLDAGVKRLSELNIWLAGAFLIFVLLVGPTLFILSLYTQSLGNYIQILPEFAFWNAAFTETQWQAWWTIFYWGWWISWSPFVGMFIARISKGRSVRELLLGVIVLPSILCFLWMAVFGGSAIHLQQNGLRDVATAVNENVATALFDMLESFPLTGLVSFVGVLLLVSFFVTSSDSGSLVVDHLTSGGKLDSPKPQRVFWACMEGAVAIALLIGGGLSALQTAAVSIGLPFALILLIMCWSCKKAFDEELDLLESHYDEQIFRSQHSGLIATAKERLQHGPTR
ncbi:MAG: BCCT family transporter [Acidimicrobiaceae bacterium]|uniref:BCCT family transporter n=1 Tax=Candidatus Poriferisodalis multihospitum TaxID=2983191 RepID=UPI002383EAB3|nr:BCCT family transporter [Candidatus Poriferisodalis multihospitum]MDE0134283.1 BCCT family transporter [Acidimicrobiaceae bacterium]MDE0319783.1 BCCT family transporter [Acidimicrobiaceae bacterium]MDE0498004.1 BCCT family transporter [Acidimicrobiaceae bacterium]